MRRFFKYGTYVYLIVFPILTALLMSLTVVNKQNYKNSSYYRFARQQFAWTVADPKPKHALKAGWSKVNVLPPVSVFTSIGNTASMVSRDSVGARALVLDNGSTLAALITLELQMMPPAVAEELQKKLPQHGFKWKDVYLSATNSKPYVGGWAKDYVGQQETGDYDQRWINQLVESVLRAVVLAKKDLATVKIGSSQVSLNNQNGSASSPGIGLLHVLGFRKTTGESAVVYTGLGQSFQQVKETVKQDLVNQINQGIEKQARWLPDFHGGRHPGCQLPSDRSRRFLCK